MTNDIVNQAKDAIIGIDLNGMIVYCNQSACTLLDYSKEELLSRSHRDIIPSDKHHEIETVKDSILFNEMTDSFRTERLTKARKLVSVSVQHSPILNSEGILTGISEIIRKLNPFEKASSKAQDLLETAPDAMVIVNSNGQIVLVNAQTENLFLYSKKELLGKLVELLIPDKFTQQHHLHRKQYSKHPKTRSMGQGMELFGKKSDGTTFPVEISLSPLKTDDGIFISAAIRDITDRKKAENKFKDLLESAPDAMVIVDEQGVIQLINAQVANIFGYEKNDLIGRSVEILIPKRFHQNHQHHRKSFFSNPKVRPMGAGLELYGKRRNGEEFPLEISLSPLDTEEGTLVSAAIRDITKRKETEKALYNYTKQLKTKNKELEQFAYVTSHDLKEPLRTVKNFVHLFDKQYKSIFDTNALKYMHFISSATDRMDKLVTGLLEYSRLGQNQQTTMVDCNVILKEVCQDLDLMITANQAKIEWDSLPKLNGYPTELRLLFQNLLSNAIKFRKKTVHPNITVSAQKEDNYWTFAVQDNGIGIDPKYHEKIFVIFKRLHSRESYEGTGIGLAHCQKIVDLHGGKIWVESQPDQGSTFFFTLSTDISDAGIEHPQKEQIL